MQMKTMLVALTALVSLHNLEAQASNLVINGNFEQTTGVLNRPLGVNTVVNGWEASIAPFVFSDIGAVASTFGYAALKIYGPATGGVDNGAVNSPTGGNFIAAYGDGFPDIGQTLNGLKAGQYTVSFDWAGAQDSVFTGPSAERWEVQLGGAPSQFTSFYYNPEHGFSGWQHETFTFTVAAGDSALWFTAWGHGDGGAPFCLLDGISVQAVGVSPQAVPEPETWALMIAGLGVVGLMLSRRRKLAAA
jgi:hypothetical protein